MKTHVSDYPLNQFVEARQPAFQQRDKKITVATGLGPIPEHEKLY